MPILLDVEGHDHHLAGRAAAPPSRAALAIGLVNNMPDPALLSTERQIFDLLEAAAGDLPVRLGLYTMESVPRSEWGRDYVGRFYRGCRELAADRLDGVIVTGTEPRAADLADEPYWPAFRDLVRWAQENTASSVFSCLAVHGAVLCLDGVARRALPEKCIGVFAQTRSADHPLLRGMPPTFATPHARWNEVRERDLSDCGYSVLSRSPASGVDCFVKRQRRSLFLHFQGHPEYEATSLLGEYRRDMARFLRRENDVCPSVPDGYFRPATERLLAAFRRRAQAMRDPAMLADFPTERLAREVRNVWSGTARRLYRNWLRYVAEVRAVPAFHAAALR